MNSPVSVLGDNVMEKHKNTASAISDLLVLLGSLAIFILLISPPLFRTLRESNEETFNSQFMNSYFKLAVGEDLSDMMKANGIIGGFRMFLHGRDSYLPVATPGEVSLYLNSVALRFRMPADAEEAIKECHLAALEHQKNEAEFARKVLSAMLRFRDSEWNRKSHLEGKGEQKH